MIKHGLTVVCWMVQRRFFSFEDLQTFEIHSLDWIFFSCLWLYFGLLQLESYFFKLSSQNQEMLNSWCCAKWKENSRKWFNCFHGNDLLHLTIKEATLEETFSADGCFSIIFIHKCIICVFGLMCHIYYVCIKNGSFALWDWSKHIRCAQTLLLNTLTANQPILYTRE